MFGGFRALMPAKTLNPKPFQGSLGLSGELRLLGAFCGSGVVLGVVVGMFPPPPAPIPTVLNSLVAE